MCFNFGNINAKEQNDQNDQNDENEVNEVNNESEFIIGFAGNICERKGWKILLAALSQLPPRFKCVLAGTGAQEAELLLLLQLPPLKGRCLFLGLLPKSQMWGFYKGVNCIVVPSLTTGSWVEQFGSVTAEAMASGTPVIGSSSGAIPEVISEAGLIFSEGSIRELCDCIHKLAASPSLREELKSKGINRFRQNFSIPAYVEKLAASFGFI
jgi:glycosyltransferase involved in cell wall biosynthesis